MDLVHRALEDWNQSLPVSRIPVERLTLAKRRWRGIAEDGREFGFDLEKPLVDGAAVFTSDAAVYVIAQKYEAVLEVRTAEIGDQGSEIRPPASDLRLPAADAARLGWMIGNLHFQIEIAGDLIRVVDDPAVRQMFEREGIPYAACKRIFHPLSGGHRH